MVHVLPLSLTPGTQVIVTAHQALVAGAMNGTAAAITGDSRVEDALRLLLLLLLSWLAGWLFFSSRLLLLLWLVTLPSFTLRCWLLYMWWPGLKTSRVP